MKQLNLALLTAAVIGLTYNSNAQYRPTGDDGITASPRVRQMLNERAVSARVASQVTVARTEVENNAPVRSIAASPKLQQMLAESRPAVHTTASNGEVVTVGYQATGTDGVTASPRVRQQLNERSQPIMVAPVK